MILTLTPQVGQGSVINPNPLYFRVTVAIVPGAIRHQPLFNGTRVFTFRPRNSRSLVWSYVFWSILSILNPHYTPPTLSMTLRHSGQVKASSRRAMFSKMVWENPHSQRSVIKSLKSSGVYSSMTARYSALTFS